MSKCSWPTCKKEATCGPYCFDHHRIYGTVELKDEDKAVTRAEQEKLYQTNRKKYLQDHPICQFKDCKLPATEIHHRRGRLGELIYNILFFMGVCYQHHKLIEKNPKWAKQEGYSDRRNS